MKALSTVVLLVVVVSFVRAENWPQWRGPRFDGVSREAGVPAEWSNAAGAERNILWRTPMSGAAGSTPVVWGERAFLTVPDGDELQLRAYATADGALLWKQTLARGNKTFRADEGNLVSPSPVTDGKHVAALMGSGELACYTVEGDPIWEFDIEDRFGELDIQFGYASTPVLHQGRLYLQIIHGEGDPATEEARVACLDFETGETIWARPRVTGASRENEHSYASPMMHLGGEDSAPVLLTHGGDALVAYHVNGEEAWRLMGLNPPGNYHPTLRFVASPAVSDDLFIVPTAKRSLVVAVRPGGKGDITNSDKVAWSLPGATPDVPTPIVHDGLVYLLSENGNLTCVDAETGEEVYRKRTTRDRHRASPLLVDGKLLLCSRKGKVTVVRVGREFEILAENDMGEEISSSPIAAGGVLYLRTFDALYAIDANE